MSHVDFKTWLCCHVDFKKVPCRMWLRSKKGCVAVSILAIINFFCMYLCMYVLMYVCMYLCIM